MPRRFVIALLFIAAILVAGSVRPASAADRSRAQGEAGSFAAYSAHQELAEVHADVFRLYWAFFDREPDVEGARYWVGQFDRCASLADITWAFANSTEFLNRYGQLGNGPFVDLVYANVLDRSPDGEGRAYWVDLLDSGELAQPEVMLYFSLGQEFRRRHPLPSDGRAYAGCRPPGSAAPVIAPGTYRVGSEVPPGVYRVSRYWATLDQNRDILDNDVVGQNGVLLAVVPESATYVQFSGEALALRDRPVVDPLVEGYTGGTYLVGNDIAPGTYRVSRPGDLAYGARLDAGLGIIDNDLNSGSVILIVEPTDYAFTFSGTLERIG